MKGDAEQESGCPDELRIFTFVIMGVRIGVDADQIAEVTDVDAARASGAALYRIHEKLSFGDMRVEYRAPKAIRIKGRNEPYYIVIDGIDDIAVIKVRSIRPIPPLIAGMDRSRALWGGVADDKGITLLIDFSKC